MYAHTCIVVNARFTRFLQAQPNIQQIHSQIPNETAQKLHVPPLSLFVQSAYSSDLPGEPFGQQQNLTTTPQGILKYGSPPHIIVFLL
jgi:hypothetical protein